MKRRSVSLMIAALLLFTAGIVRADSEFSNVNLRPFYFTTKFSDDQDFRAGVVLDLVFPLYPVESDSARLFGGPYFGGVTLAARGENSVSTFEVGKLYYVFGDLFESSFSFLPSVKVYRNSSVRYKENDGDTKDAEEITWVLPGFEACYRVGFGLALHLSAELYNYARPENYAAAGGVTYTPTRMLTLGAIVELFSWDIEVEQNGTVFEAWGDSNSALAKLIFRPRADEHLGGWAIVVAAGYENLNNEGKPAVLESGNMDFEGLQVQVSVGTGAIVW